MDLNELRNTIIAARAAYYHGGNALMDDAEYDRLEEQLRSLAPNDPLLGQVGAPIAADSILEKVKHPEWAFMGSLFKVNTAPELDEWAVGLPAGENPGYHVSYKGDGASIALYYEDGKFVQAISRGDGVEGEDVTANAAKMQGIRHDVSPFLRSSEVGFTGVVRCEVILTIENWAKIDPTMAKNPRNVGNGIMGRKDGTQCEYLSLRAFDVALNPSVPSNIVFATESSKFQFLESLGFTCIDWAAFPVIESVKAWYHETEAKRPTLPFWIDGVVVRHNDLAVQAEAGVRDQRPKGQRAWKFVAEKVQTILTGCELSVGHTGAVIPTGVLQPVEIGGTTVSRVLLNNWEEIGRLGLKEGDRVEVIKANDIIPKITRVVSTEEGNAPLLEPERCPCCGHPTSRQVNTGGDAGAMTVCTNSECDAQSIGKVKRWIKSLNILGIGDTLLEGLFESGMVKSPADLYQLDRDQLKEAVISPKTGARVGEKRADAILAEVEKTRKLTVPQFLGSLGVKFLGKRKVELMIEAAPELGCSLDPWRDGSLVGELGQKAGVPEAGREIHEGMRKACNTIDRLVMEVEVVFNDPEIPVTHIQPEGGKKICISGKLPSGRTKAQYAEPLAAKGHELVKSVTGTTDLLVLADPDSTSAKAQKARKMGIEIIGEEQLQAYV